MALQDTSQNNIETVCTICGSITQKVMADTVNKPLLSHYKCINCGCLVKDHACDYGVTEYIPKNKYFCRDTFLSFSVTKKLSQLFSENGVCIVSSQNNSSFLTRMFIENNYETITLRFVEESNFFGVELNEYAYRTVSTEDRLAGKIFIVFGTLSQLKNPLNFFLSIEKMRPRCIVTVMDVYDGENLPYEVLQDVPTYNHTFYSQKTLQHIAQQINCTVTFTDTVCVFISNKFDSQPVQITKLSDLIPLSEQDEFYEYIAATTKKNINIKKVSAGVEKNKYTYKFYNQWHLGDNVFHLNYLRKLVKKYNCKVEYHVHEKYIPELSTMIEHYPDIVLVPLGEIKADMINAWIGEIYFSLTDKFYYNELYITWFNYLSAKLNLECVVDSMIMDWEEFQDVPRNTDYDVLFINSASLSKEYDTNEEEEYIVASYLAKNNRIITTKKIPGFDCTLDKNMTLLDIGRLSIGVKTLIGVNTSPLILCLNNRTLELVENVYVIAKSHGYNLSDKFHYANNIFELKQQLGIN